MIARPERPARRLRRWVLASVRAEGCCCDATVDVTHTRAGLAVTAVYHDEWCPLLRVRSEGAGGVPMDVILYRDREARA